MSALIYRDTLKNLKEMIMGEVDRVKDSLSTDGSGSKVKIKVASATFDESEVKSSAVHNVSSSITSHEGSVKLDSSDDITITGSNLQAAENIDLKSTTGNITIQEATDSQSVDSKEKHASAEISATVQNEYVEIVSALQAAVKSAEQLKKVKEDYQNYKRSVKELEAALDTIKQQYRDKVPGVDYSDIEDLGEVISNAKEDQKYYVAAIAAATVGNNLNVESVRDSSSSNSNGFNVSAGISSSTTAKTSSSGANGSLGSNTGRTLNKQTVLTSLTGDNVNITVGEETHLKGSLVAAGSTDENGVFQDNNNLNLSTKTLTFENSTNTNYSSSNSMNVGTSYSDTLNKEKNEHKDKTTLTTSFSTGMTYERTKTLATLGTGNITITDKENSDDTDRLNRDTTKVDKSLFKTTTGTSVDATLDTRLLTEKGQEEIRQEVKEAAAGAIGATAFVGNIITGNMDVDNAIKSYQDPYKTAEALRNNPELAATLDAFTKGEFDNLPKTKEALQTLANATGLNVDVLLTTITSYENAKGTTDQNLVALDVNKENRPDTLATLGHEENHARGGTNETLADMSGYATQLLSEVAIGSHDTATLNAIQFEMGAGKDTQTQMANQVLLGSDNQILLNALNDHQLEFYFKQYEDPRLNVFYGTKTGISPEEKAGFIQGVKNVNTFSTAGAITSALDETTLIFTPFLSATGLLTEWMLWKMGDTNFGEITRGQMIDHLPGESPKAKIVKEVAKEVSKQVLPVDKN